MLRLALNRLGETGAWDFEELRLEFEELIDLGCDVIDSGFEMAEVDALLIEDADAAGVAEAEEAMTPTGPPVSRPGDLWRLGRHRLLQADARRCGELRLMLSGEGPASCSPTCPTTSAWRPRHLEGDHREFAMAAGEMSREEFAAFNRAWMSSAAFYIIDGGLIGTFIDWRSVDLVIGCGRELGLELINVIVWSKSNAGQGSLWRSQHELLPGLQKG